MVDKTQKNSRTLHMYARLCEGRVINKIEEAERFGVDERSIQRDIDDIRAFLDEKRTSDSPDGRTIEYSRSKKGFQMLGAEGSSMTNTEILAVSKILLESRAFTKQEITTILNKMVEGCVPLKNMKLVSDLIANEKYHYVELHHKTIIQDKLWDIGSNIELSNLMEIKYTKAEDQKKIVKRVIDRKSVV